MKHCIIIAILVAVGSLGKAQNSGTITVRKAPLTGEKALHGRWVERGCMDKPNGQLQPRTSNNVEMQFHPNNSLTSQMGTGSNVVLSTARWKRTGDGRMLELSQRRRDGKPVSDTWVSIFSVTEQQLIFLADGGPNCPYIVYDRVEVQAIEITD